MSQNETRDSDEAVYLLQGLDDRAVQEEIDKFWKDLQTSPDWQAHVQEAGFTLDEVLDLESQNPIRIRTGESGIEPGTITIIVAFAPVITTVARDVWARFILPRLEQRFGTGSVRKAQKED